MNSTGHRFKNWIGGNRKLKKLMGPLFSEMGEVEVTSQFKVSVDFRDLGGPSYYLLHGGSAAFFHYEEAEKAEIIQALPTDGVFLDIGANIGLFSFYVARLFPQAKVFAFEPHPRLYRCLTETIKSSGLSHVAATQACVSSRDGEIELLLNSKDSGGHTTDQNQITAKELQNKLNVDCLALDTFIKSKRISEVDVIKIDVQGAEWDVLDGARDVIAQSEPKIVIELDNQRVVTNDALVKKVLTRMAGLDYRVRRVFENKSHMIPKLATLASDDLKRGILQTNYVFEALV